MHVLKPHAKTGVMKWRHVGFEPDKAADYLVRYIRFMNSKGFTISYLDLKNEACTQNPPGGRGSDGRTHPGTTGR